MQVGAWDYVNHRDHYVIVEVALRDETKNGQKNIAVLLSPAIISARRYIVFLSRVVSAYT